MIMRYLLFKSSLSVALILFMSTGTIQSQEYIVDLEKTLVSWEGKGIGKAHHGTIKVKSGILHLNDGRPVKGKVMIDMTSIKNLDLDSEDMRERLINHLKSDDFFSVDKYPEAHFTITSSELRGTELYLGGDLNIKGRSHPAEFKSGILAAADGYRFIGYVEFDRSLYDVRYGSGKFFENLGDKLISDIIKLDFNLYVK